MKRQQTRIVNTLVGLMSLILTATTAFAQKTGVPQPALTRVQPAWIGIVLMIIMVMVVVFVSLLSSKRSHQD
ncbi:MAG TPA: hypothetical protein VG711_10945 [Phycisphaerales bacterium]|nr:hypothetical protein [Phycisphaerales bacterium]